MKLPIKLAFGARASFCDNYGGTLPFAQMEGYRVLWQSSRAYVTRHEEAGEIGYAKFHYPKAAVSILVSDGLRSVFNSPRRKWQEMLNRLYYDRLAEQYERGVEEGRKQAYFNPELFDSDISEEAATYFGLSADDYDKKFMGASADWYFQHQHRRLGRDLPLPLHIGTVTND